MRQIALGFIFGVIALLALAGVALYFRIDAMVAIAEVMDKNEGFFVGTFTASLFLATVFLWLSTYSLWSAEERHLKHLTETSKRELRAYVHLKQVDFPFSRHPPTVGAYGPILGQIHTFHLTPILENSGQTPTRHAFVAMNYQCMIDKLPPDFAFPDLESTQIEAATIGPRSVFYAPVINIPVEDVNRAIAGARYLYAWGWIDYDDIFEGSPRHRTEFCFQIVPDKLPPSEEIKIRFINHNTFNGADEDCLRDPTPYHDPRKYRPTRR